MSQLPYPRSTPYLSAYPTEYQTPSNYPSTYQLPIDYRRIYPPPAYPGAYTGAPYLPSAIGSIAYRAPANPSNVPAYGAFSIKQQHIESPQWQDFLNYYASADSHELCNLLIAASDWFNGAQERADLLRLLFPTSQAQSGIIQAAAAEGLPTGTEE